MPTADMTAETMALLSQPKKKRDRLVLGTQEAVERLIKLEEEHDANSGHDSGDYGTALTTKKKRDRLVLGTKEANEEFSKRLAELEKNHDDNSGHNSGDY